MFLKNIFCENIFDKNIFGENVFDKNIFGENILDENNPYLISAPHASVIFEVECDTTNEGLTDRTEHTMIVPFIVLDSLTFFPRKSSNFFFHRKVGYYPPNKKFLDNFAITCDFEDQKAIFFKKMHFLARK